MKANASGSSVLFFMYIIMASSSAHLRLLGPQQQPEVRHDVPNGIAAITKVPAEGWLQWVALCGCYRDLREHPRGPRGARQLRIRA